MNFSIKTPLMVTLFGITLGLTGCGGSDDNASYYNGGGSNNSGTDNPAVLKYNYFDRRYEDASDIPTNIVREDVIIANGSLTLSNKGLLKTYTPRVSGYQYDIGDHYFKKYMDNDPSYVKNITVSKPSSDRYLVSYNTLGDNNQSISHTMQLKEIDISGSYDFAKHEAQGFYTWVDNQRFNKLPAVVNFPTGSGCFVFEKTTQAKVTYSFDGVNSSEYTDLDSYINAQYKVIPSSIKKYNIGANNEWQAVQFQQGNAEDLSYAVYYNGKVYEDVNVNELVETENTDISKGEVHCEPLNSVAADYMEQQLLTAYK